MNVFRKNCRKIPPPPSIIITNPAINSYKRKHKMPPSPTPIFFLFYTGPIPQIFLLFPNFRIPEDHAIIIAITAIMATAARTVAAMHRDAVVVMFIVGLLAR